MEKCCDMPRLTEQKAHRQWQESPVKSSQSNGFMERSIQTIEGQVRTLKLALENCVGVKLGQD